MRFDQISNHKHDIYLYGKLSTKLLVQAANKNTKILYLQKLDSSLSMVSEVIDRKNSKQVSWRTVQKPPAEFSKVTFNRKANKYWANLLFLISY